MRNEDAFVGVSLLPFNVKRTNTERVHNHGIMVCTEPKEVVSTCGLLPTLCKTLTRFVTVHSSANFNW